jgi:hypothetical protein
MGNSYSAGKNKPDKTGIFLQILSLGIPKYLNNEDLIKIHYASNRCKRRLSQILFQKNIKFMPHEYDNRNFMCAVNFSFRCNIARVSNYRYSYNPKEMYMLRHSIKLILNIDLFEEIMPYCPNVEFIVTNLKLNIQKVMCYPQVKEFVSHARLEDDVSYASTFPNLINLDLDSNTNHPIPLNTFLPNTLMRLKLTHMYPTALPEFLQELSISHPTNCLIVLPKLSDSIHKIKLEGHFSYKYAWPFSLKNVTLKGVFEFDFRLSDNLDILRLKLINQTTKGQPLKQKILLPFVTKYLILTESANYLAQKSQILFLEENSFVEILVMQTTVKHALHYLRPSFIEKDSDIMKTKFCFENDAISRSIRTKHLMYMCKHGQNPPQSTINPGISEHEVKFF